MNIPLPTVGGTDGSRGAFPGEIKPRAPALSLSAEQQWSLIEAARDSSPVVGLTHSFYRYPARFPPQMVRSVIEAFTKPGDTVLDPYMGGATTLVEAVASGRQAIGTDISTLATFVAQAKTTLLSDDDLVKAEVWAKETAAQISMMAPEPSFSQWAKDGYFKHLDQKPYWRIRKGIAQCITATERCRTPALERFARCIVLRTAQWALDGRRSVPGIDEFRHAIVSGSIEMVAGMRELKTAALGHAQRSILCLNRSAVGLESDPAVQRRHAKLVMTSPPYPGVHVLYHRWQVGGGKETGTPFWIANSLDGAGASYYTMGDRKSTTLNRYFETIESSLKSVAALCADDATIVQVVAFSQPDWQLPRYLQAAEKAGLMELRLPVLAAVADGRLWRAVPNRRWYAQQKGKTAGSNEVVLFHQIRNIT